jgi:hypothetical protein
MALDMYHTLLSSDALVPESIQRAAAKSALKEKGASSDNVLIKLAERSDLVKDVQKMIEECDRAKVRAAWLSRPGLSQSELEALIKKEKRATVLAKVAAASETPVYLLEALAKDGKPLVCEALMSNPNTPNKSLVLVLSKLAENPRSTRVRWDVQKVITDRKDLQDELAQIAGTTVASWLLSESPGFSEKAVKRIFTILVKDPIKSALSQATNRPDVLTESRYSYRNTVRKSVENALSALDILAQSNHLTWKEIEKIAKEWNALQLLAISQKVEFTAKGAHASQVLKALAGDTEAKASFAEREIIKEQVFNEIKNSQDDDLLTQTCRAALSSSNDDVNMYAKIQGLCENKNLKGKHFELHLLSYSNKNVARKLFDSALSNNNGESDLELAKLAVQLSNNYRDEWTESMLKTVKEKSETLFKNVLECYVDELLEYPWRIDQGALSNLPDLIVIITRKVSPKQLAQLGQVAPAVVDGINQELNSILGDNPKNWESFTSLAQEVTQPILEVAKAAKLLTK